jgi:hypothetical protein
MKKEVIPVATAISVLLVAAVSSALSGLEFCQIEVKAETKSGYSFDDPVILFEIPNERQVGFYVDSHWQPNAFQVGVQLGEVVFLMLKETLFRAGGFPAFANGTLVVSDESEKFVWTYDMGPVGEVWSANPSGGASGFCWRPNAVGNYTVGIIFEDFIYADDFPSDFSDAVSIRVCRPSAFVGKVTSGYDLKAISNASVEALVNGEVKATTTTNSEGAFNLELQETGVYDVRASAPGYTPVVQRWVNTELEPKQIDFVLAPISLAPNFNILWRANLGDSRNVVVDSQGNVIVASEGEISHTVVSKFDPDCNLLWEISESFSGASEVPRGLAVDSADNILLLVEPNDIWSYNLYTVKLDPNGNRIWKESFDSGENDQSTSIAVDSLDNVIVIGVVHAEGKSTLVKYTSGGDVIWSKTLPIYFDLGEITVDSGNNIILGGSVLLDSIGVDYYVAKLDDDGNLLWEKTFDCKERKYDYGYGVSLDDNDDYGCAVSLDSSENIIVTGNKITVKLGSDGSEIWLKYFLGDDLVVDLDNNIFAIRDSFVEMYDANGLLLGNIDLTEKLYSIAICQNSTLIVAGAQNVMKLCVDDSATTQYDPTTETETPANADLNTPPENTSDTTSSEPTSMSNPEPTISPPQPSESSPEPSQGNLPENQQANEAPPVSAFTLMISIGAVSTVSTIYKKHKR